MKSHRRSTSGRSTTLPRRFMSPADPRPGAMRPTAAFESPAPAIRQPLTPATLVAHPGVTTASVNGVTKAFFDSGMGTQRYSLSPLALEILAWFAEPAEVAEVLRTAGPGRRD